MTAFIREVIIVLSAMIFIGVIVNATRADDTDLTGPIYWAGVCDGLGAAGVWVRAVKHGGIETPCTGTGAPDAVVYEWRR